MDFLAPAFAVLTGAVLTNACAELSAINVGMMGRIAPHQIKTGQMLEMPSDRGFLSDADAAMELNSLLRHEAGVATDDGLRRGDRRATLFSFSA